jgi:hypothetical protein
VEKRKDIGQGKGGDLGIFWGMVIVGRILAACPRLCGHFGRFGVDGGHRRAKGEQKKMSGHKKVEDEEVEEVEEDVEEEDGMG